MKAIILERFGSVDGFRLSDVDDPTASAGQVRVAVRAAGVNPVDIGSRIDGSWAGITTPCILGYDLAGVVDQVGPGAEEISIGDRVMALAPFPNGPRAYAECAVLEADQIAVLADTVSFVDAAATPLAGGTADILLERLGLRRGGTLLVLGASGGVGSYLLQLAAANDLRVVAVGRGEMHATMLGEGATACIDYRTEDVVDRVRSITGGRVDAIADLIGGSLLAACTGALKDGGSIASIAKPELDVDVLLDHNITFHGVLITNDGPRTRRLATSLAKGILRPRVSHTFPLASVAEAHEVVASGHAGGKIVLIVQGAP